VLRRPVLSGFLPLVTVLSIAGCSLNDPALVTTVNPQRTDSGAPSAPLLDAGVGGSAGSGGAGSGGSAGGPSIPPEVLPSSCTTGETLACGPSTENGECTLGTRVCINGVWGDCIGAVFATTRLCAERADRDCDGLPDDTADAICECVPDTSEPCETHPGLDGVGACKAGQRLCVAAADGQSSRWGACVGSVGPAEADSCTLRGDDANCDAIPNTGCPCIEGEVVPCGAGDEGICRTGTSTCVDQKPTECKDAILPEARDCSSEDDNDCDGVEDNDIDDVCTCEVGETEPCGTHPQDGVGLCRAGTRTCVTGDEGSSSAFSATCVGSVGPSPRRCNVAADGNCDGKPDNTIDTTCRCEIGITQSCETHPGLDGVGRCRAGTQLCVAGPDNTTSAFAACSGSIGPALADSCLTRNDDNCDGEVNGGCECVAGLGNAPCAGTPAASRCDAAGKCAACVVNADCALVKGLNACSAGVCVQCTTAAQCLAGEVCSPTFVCEAAPVVPVPAPVVPVPAAVKPTPAAAAAAD
jgi:hypothetical protein